MDTKDAQENESLRSQLAAKSAEAERLKAVSESLLSSYASRRRVHVGQGPVGGQIGADEYDRYWAVLHPRDAALAPRAEKPTKGCDGNCGVSCEDLCTGCSNGVSHCTCEPAEKTAGEGE